MSDTPIFYNLQTAGNVTAITGRLSDLETTVNTNLVAAINEIDGKFPVSVANGGTGRTSLTSGNILLGNGTDNITTTAKLGIAKGGTGGTTASEARENLGVMTFTSLFADPSGAHDDITLSDTIANYDIIELFYAMAQTGGTSSGVYHGGSYRAFNNKSSTCGFNIVHTDGFFDLTAQEERLELMSTMVNISGTTLTFGDQKMCVFRPKNTSSTAGTVTVQNTTTALQLKVYKIIGYSY